MSPEVETVARAIAQARREQQPQATAPLQPLLSAPEQAYQVQEEVAREFGWFGDAVPRFWKSGGPSRTAVLTHAPLPPANVWNSPAEASGSHFNVRVIEAEIALRLARDVTPEDAAHLTHDTAHELIDAMAVSIEIVDSRWQHFMQAPPLLKLADLQSHGALALGEWRPYEARAWAEQTCAVQIGSAAEQTFRGTHSLGGPAWLLPIWLSHVVQRFSAPVPRGTVVTTGTWCGMLEAAKGDLVRVRFDGVGEASVQL